ncbi:MAG: HAMP domain-containing protein [Gammaproteobacteria bacterium]|nr:HAMP domain-containing protein [Gammaproteobacteria bacterium]
MSFFNKIRLTSQNKTRATGKPHRQEYFPIAYKLALIFTLLISLGMAALGLIIVTQQTRLLDDQMQHFGQTVVRQLAESSKELILSGDILSLMVVNSNLGNEANILGSVVYADNGKILASSGLVPHNGIINLYSESQKLNQSNYIANWDTTDKSGKRLDVVSFIVPIRYQDVIAGHALVSFNETLMNEAIYSTITTITSATLIMIGFGIIISFIMGKWISRPIHTLMDASRAIGEGDYDIRINEPRNDEIGYLTDALNTMASNLLEKSQVENAFSRFVSPSVAKQIMKNLDHVQLGGKHVEASVLFADIAGFTSLSERLSANEVAELLNEYFGYIATVSQLYHGTIDKYMGDCVMIVFGVPEHDQNHKYNAVSCGLVIQALIDELNRQREAQGKFPVHFRIGINSGSMVAGNMGAAERMQYTVVGETVNLASRLHTAADVGEIIVTETLYNDPTIKQRVKARYHGIVELKGIAKPVTTYIITDMADKHAASINNTISGIISHQYIA